MVCMFPYLLRRTHHTFTVILCMVGTYVSISSLLYKPYHMSLLYVRSSLYRAQDRYSLCHTHAVFVSMVVLGMVPMLLPQLWSLPYGTIPNIMQGAVGDVSYIWYVCMCIFSLPYTCGLCSTSTVRTYLYIRSLPYIQWSYVWYVQYICVHNFIALPYPCRYIRYGIQVRTYVRTICTVRIWKRCKLYFSLARAHF